LIHYWLVNNRGGEKVLAELASLFPKVDLFTHVYDAEKVPKEINRLNVRTTFINRLPFATKLYQSYLPLMPLALQTLNLKGYDLIISTESGPAKGIRKPKGTVHICCCFTPMRYLWDMTDEYYATASLLKKAGMKLLLPALRKWDIWSATQVDCFIAISEFVADRILRVYGRESIVIYPPVDTERFSAIERNPQDFYLCFGQLTAYKRADLAIEAFSRTGKRLVIAGSGNESERLKATAGKNVEFLGRVSDDQLDELYSTCRALIFPGIEDFGMVPVEAQAAGAPVIAFRGGGALETIRENKTGIFFDEPSEDSLIEAVNRFEKMQFDPLICRQQAKKFSPDNFRIQFLSLLKDLQKDKNCSVKIDLNQ
jgi:glycosyltransferase involved in cell wall biosynthesis